MGKFFCLYTLFEVAKYSDYIIQNVLYNIQPILLHLVDRSTDPQHPSTSNKHLSTFYLFVNYDGGIKINLLQSNNDKKV